MEVVLANSNDTEVLVTQAVGGDAGALAVLMERYRDRLKRMVGLRLGRRPQGRVDASDVVQEALIDAARRLDEYAADPPMGFFLWLRWLTGEKLLNAHRRLTLLLLLRREAEALFPSDHKPLGASPSPHSVSALPGEFPGASPPSLPHAVSGSHPLTRDRLVDPALSVRTKNVCTD